MSKRKAFLFGVVVGVSATTSAVAYAIGSMIVRDLQREDAEELARLEQYTRPLR